MTGADPLAPVRASYDAFARGDRAAMEALLADDFTFHAPPDPDLDRDGYFTRCWPQAGSATAFDFVRLREIGDDEVLVTYEATRAEGGRFRNTEIVALRGDLILRVEVYFGWDLPTSRG